MRQNVYDNIKYFSDNYPWFRRSDSLSVQQSIQYFMSDSLYWNRAKHYEGIQRSAGDRIMRCRILSIVLLAKIQLSRKKITPADLAAFFQQCGLQALNSLDCQEEIDWNKPPSHSYSLNLLYNATDTLVEPYEIGKGKRFFSFPISPIPADSFIIRGHSHSKKRIFQLNTQECHRRFSWVKNGFLLIE